MFRANHTPDLFRRSYIRGLSIFFYGLVWLFAMLAGYPLLDSLLPTASTLTMALLIATLSAALAGGLGGTTAMLSRLYQHLSIEQDFQQQSLFSYLIQPIIGLIVGILALYFVAILGAVIVNYATSQQFLLAEILASPTFTAIHILLGWIAGFYQQRGLGKIKAFTQSKGDEGQSKESAAVSLVDEDEPLFYKAWFLYQKQMIRWSYTWGVFLLVYGILWLLGLVTVFFMAGGIFSGLQANSQTLAASLMLAALPVAAAGGMGGVCSLWYDLYWHVSIKQDFHRQHLMSYLVRPIIGFVFGLVMYLLLASGYLTFASEDGEPKVVDSSTVIMIQLLFGWIAGFRQQTINDSVQGLIQQLISLFKRAVRLLNPVTWFNKTQQAEVLEDIAAQPGVFAGVNFGEDDSQNRKWWQFD